MKIKFKYWGLISLIIFLLSLNIVLAETGNLTLNYLVANQTVILWNDLNPIKVLSGNGSLILNYEHFCGFNISTLDELQKTIDNFMLNLSNKTLDYRLSDKELSRIYTEVEDANEEFREVLVSEIDNTITPNLNKLVEQYNCTLLMNEKNTQIETLKLKNEQQEKDFIWLVAVCVIELLIIGGMIIFILKGGEFFNRLK